MPQNDGDKLNRIEELKSKLFTKSYQTKIEHRDRFTHLTRSDIPEVWENSKRIVAKASYSTGNFFMKSSMFKKFFIFSLGFFALTLLYAGVIFIGGGNTVSNDKIDITVVGNNFADGGEDLSLVINIANRNNSSLEFVDLIIVYPKSSSGEEGDSPTGTDRLRQPLGTIPPGSVRKENVKLVLFGEQGSIRPIRISLEYRVPGSNAIFVKEKSYSVTINSTPLNISIDAPATISPNQDITLGVKASLNSTRPASQIVLKMDYPPGFQFTSSTPLPSLGNNVWSLGDLPAGGERNISILGKMVDVFDGEEKTFRVSGGLQSSADKSVVGVVLNSMSHTVGISKPFIEASLSINGLTQRVYATDSKSPVRAQIQWKNNSETKVNDLEIRAKISGNAVDRRTISGEMGFYDSSKDIVIWDKNSINNFREISPGDSGFVNLSLSPLSLFSASGGLLNNPSMNIEISVSGKQVSEGYGESDVNSFDSSVVRIISDVGLSAKALHFSGAFTNKGPIPPKVEEETTYTIVWALSNTSNNISKATVKSSLPSWVSFVGVLSPATENVTYNSSAREINWNIGAIPKGTGITLGARSVSFQIKLKPSLSQVGTTPVLINEAVLTGHDDFANVDVKLNKVSLRTSLNDDPSFPANGGSVVE